MGREAKAVKEARAARVVREVRVAKALVVGVVWEVAQVITHRLAGIRWR